MFLPEDIDVAVFSRTLGGYSPREVDEYLAELKEKFEEICSENADLRAEIETLRAALAESAAIAAAAAASVEETETVEEPEVVEETETIEEPEAVEEPETVEGSETIEEPEAIEEPETVEEPEVVEGSGEDEDPETIQIPLMPDDEYGEDEVASAVTETSEEAEEAEEAAEEAEAEEADEADEEEEFVFETESADADAPQEDAAAPAADGDIKFEDIEEALLKVYGDWRKPEDTEADKADPAIFRGAWGETVEDGADGEGTEADEEPETDEEPGVDADTDADEDAADEETAPADVQHEDTPAQVTAYKKRIYHIRKKSAQPSDADDDADFSLHNYDEYNYFFGDGKK